MHANTPALLAALALTSALAQAAASGNAANVSQAAKPNKLSASDVIKASQSSEWRPLDPANTLYMDLPGGRVVIELAPDFAPKHAANIRTLVKERYFDGLVVLRSHDNYVAQWGDANEQQPRALGSAQPKLAAEFTVPMSNDKHFVRLPDHDGYAPQVGHSNGFPAARDPKSKTTWLAHCYGMVGVGRDTDSDSGNGTSLYAVNGHAPRHLDRNVTLVGRVVAGMTLLSSLPRGTGPLGFYEKPEQHVPITSVRLAADVPEAERARLEVMRTDSASFKAVAESQRNRPGPWAKVPAGHIELCNVTIPVREQSPAVR